MIPFLVIISGIIVLTILVTGTLEYLSYRQKEGREIKSIVIIFIVSLLITLFLVASAFIISHMYSNEKHIEIIPIKNIYSIEHNKYTIEGYNETIYTVTTSEVVEGDDNYIIYTTYPNSSFLSKFLIFGPYDSCSIVVKDISNIPTTEKLTN